MRTRRRQARNERQRIREVVNLERCELAAIHGLLMVGRGYSLEAISRAEAQGNRRQADASRANLAKADKAIDLLERELVATQPKGSEP